MAVVDIFNTDKKYKTILVDPPWEEKWNYSKTYKHTSGSNLPYQVMTFGEIQDLPVGNLADIGCHLWLWTTNQFLRDGFDLMEGWGFKYLAPIVWIKPSGFGYRFIHRTQTILFGYKGKCLFNLERNKPNVIFANAKRHSQKPDASYDYIEGVSDELRIELFARTQRFGWDCWGNEVQANGDGVRGMNPY